MFSKKMLIKKVKERKKNLLQFQMYFFLDWHVIKHSYKCLSVYYINIIIIFNVGNSLIFFPIKNLANLFSLAPRTVFLLSKNTSI